MIKQQARQVIEDMVKKLVREYRPERVVLFGSCAYGTPDQDSDIDLLIVKNTPERLTKRMLTVRKILTDPNRRIGLEIFVLTPDELSNRLAIGDQFIEQITEKGKVLYSA